MHCFPAVNDKREDVNIFQGYETAAMFFLHVPPHMSEMGLKSIFYINNRQDFIKICTQ